MKNSNGIHAGKFGDVGVFSFQAMKNIQCLMGGAIISRNLEFSAWLNKEQLSLKEISLLRVLNKLLYIFFVDFLTKVKFVNFIFFQIIKISYKNNINFILKLIRADHLPVLNNNYLENFSKLMTNAQAGIINLSLKNLDLQTEIRKKKAFTYYKHLKNCNGITMLPNKNFNNRNHLEFPIICENKEKLFNYLIKKNIDVRKYYYRDLSSLKCYKEYGRKCLNSLEMENKILTLPCYPEYSENNIHKIINAIQLFYKNYNLES